jgi:hypothetical protein
VLEKKTVTMTMADERMLKLPEVADRLRVHRETVRRWLASGKIHGVRLAHIEAAGDTVTPQAARTLLERIHALEADSTHYLGSHMGQQGDNQ